MTVEEFLKLCEVSEKIHGGKYWFCHGFLTSRLVADKKTEASFDYFLKIFGEVVQMQSIALGENA